MQKVFANNICFSKLMAVADLKSKEREVSGHFEMSLSLNVLNQINSYGHVMNQDYASL